MAAGLQKASKTLDSLTARIGFMQGRFSPPVGGKIQAFPWDYWREEFALAKDNRFGLMEWTLDHERLYENPLMNERGRREIKERCARYGVRIESLTGDLFMQAPFYKADGDSRKQRITDLLSTLEACSSLGIGYVVFPLVDNGRIEDKSQERDVVCALVSLSSLLAKHHIKIVFESDFSPSEFGRFIDGFPLDTFGINYDIGNSASLGFDPVEEIAIFGSRVLNVHIKDRTLGGSTVPLGLGNANFVEVFRQLSKVDYRGNFILQTARAVDGEHGSALCRYREMVSGWINQAACGASANR